MNKDVIKMSIKIYKNKCKYLNTLTEEFLRNSYIYNKNSTRTIALSLNCDKNIILYWLKKYNIKRRTISEANKGRVSFRKGKHLSKSHGNNIRLALIGRKLTRIHRMKISENHANVSGVNNGFYGKEHTQAQRKKWSLIHGGNGKPYDYDEYNITFYRARKQILLRDKDTCQKCFSNGLCVHHIDYNKNNNKLTNLIALCSKCHGLTNFDRDYWYAYFTYIRENK